MSNLKTELEAYAFRKLVAHLQQKTDIQNIDLMIHGDFCRNCLAKWYAEAAKEKELQLGYEEAREVIYGMPYEEWKTKYQQEATEQQLALLAQKLKRTEG